MTESNAQVLKKFIIGSVELRRLSIYVLKIITHIKWIHSYQRVLMYLHQLFVLDMLC